MSAQLDIWRQVRTGDPDTSREAVRRHQGFGGQRAQVLAALCALGSGSCYDLADATGLTHVQVCRRLAELGPEGTGEAEVIGRTTSPQGDRVRVWRAKEAT